MQSIRLQWPVQKTAPVTQRFGENPGAGYACRDDGSHNGVDFGVIEGTPVYAAAAGQVVRADMDTTGYGLHVRIQHDGYLSLYGHLRTVCVHAGERVDAGTMIGESGSTGWSTGPHLHFEIRRVADNCKTCVDPLLYLVAASPTPQPDLPSPDPHPNPLPEGEGEEGDVGVRRMAVLVDGLRIRNGAGQQHGVMGAANAGDVVEVTELWARRPDGLWMAVYFDGDALMEDV